MINTSIYNERSSNRWVTMIHTSEDTKELGYRGVAFVSAECQVSMYIVGISQRADLLLSESWVIVECMLADIV